MERNLEALFLEERFNNAVGMKVLREALGAPNNPFLFPPHFLEATFPKIGGKCLVVQESGDLLGGIFMFPQSGKDKNYTARLHLSLLGKERLNYSDFYGCLYSTGLGELYIPEDGHMYSPSHDMIGDLDIGRPSEEEALKIRELQQRIWGSENDFLYPSDIHSSDFGLGTSLVVRDRESLVAFLFGFYKFDAIGVDGRKREGLAIESQLMGVDPTCREQGIATRLKIKQAKDALDKGIKIINWTVDPLQFGNAILNFGRLRAFGSAFYPDYYSFRNDLNRVPASRFVISWPLESRRVAGVLSGEKAVKSTVELREIESVVLANVGLEIKEEDWGNVIALEVPSNWSEVQKNDSLALQWRKTTDEIFTKCFDGGYIFSDVATNDDRKYLIARKLDRRLYE